MNTKKFLACFLASAMMCGALASCGSSDDSKSDSSSKAETTAAEESETEAEGETEAEAETEAEGETEAASEDEEVPTAAPVDTGDLEFEEAIEAGEGDAYLQIVDGQWWIQYTGLKTDLLTYDAGVVHIDGNGDYTVSVTADTLGFRYDATQGQDINSDVLPFGTSFAAVIVRGGASLYPNMAIDITAIRIDGEDIPLTAKGFTCIDDAYGDDDLDDMRSNIYNQWVTNLPEDAHDANGAVTADDGYSATIIDTAAFDKDWTTVEVDFTVSGIE